MTGRRCADAGDDVEESGLACAVRADEPEDLAMRDIDADVVERGDPAEAHGDALEVERRRGVGAGRAGRCRFPRRLYRRHRQHHRRATCHVCDACFCRQGADDRCLVAVHQDTARSCWRHRDRKSGREDHIHAAEDLIQRFNDRVGPERGASHCSCIDALRKTESAMGVAPELGGYQWPQAGIHFSRLPQNHRTMDFSHCPVVGHLDWRHLEAQETYATDYFA